MTSDLNTVYDLIVEIRGAFNDLKTYSDHENSDLNVTAAMRAVMEYLNNNGPQPVPDIARAKNVTRQHIQQLADALVSNGFARFETNPAHKRSKLVCLTDEGERAFLTIQHREKEALSKLATTFEGSELERVTDTIADFRKKLRALS